MMFDGSNAFLRYIRLGDHELVRGVFAAVRDHNWNTVPFSINDLQVDRAVDSFSIVFVANSLIPEIGFSWHGRIEGDCDGVVKYRFLGTANNAFDRNRIGICVLHSSNVCAGLTCRVEHVDGSSTQAKFPKVISPHQPFKNVRAITHQVGAGTQVKVTMNGDTFETEDQRNWTDASFKTYSTPLDIPFPVRLERGTTIEQSVSIELIEAEYVGRGLGRQNVVDQVATSIRQVKVIEPPSVRVVIDWKQPIRRPAVGFQWPSGVHSHDPRTVTDRLKEIRPDHLRFDLRLNQDWRTELSRAIAATQAIDTKLEIALFVDRAVGEDWEAWIQKLSQLPVEIARVLVFHPTEKSTPSELVDSVSKAFKKINSLPPLVVGSNAYFAELNRGRPRIVPGCKVCYSINPQVHAFDNGSLSETLEAQRATVDSAASIFGTDVVISPLTLRPRFNPNATSTLDAEAQLETAIDPRQTTGFGAAWTTGVFASLLTHANVNSLTLYEAFGPRGVIGIDGREYPMTEPIKHLLRSEKTFYGSSSSSLGLVALGTQREDGQMHVVFGNLSEEDVIVRFMTTCLHDRSVVVAAESSQIVFMEQSVNA